MEHVFVPTRPMQDAEVIMLSKKVLERVAHLIHSQNVENDWKMLTWLQKEQAPHLGQEEIEDCVIYSLVRHYEDYELSWMWHQEKSHGESHHSIAA